NYSVLYMRVRKDLLERLGRGEWATGDRLPTEAQLAAEYGVSRTTIRNALKALVSEGYVVQRQGAGTFVAEGRRAVAGGEVHIILPNVDPTFTLELFLGAQEVLKQEGYQPVFLCSDESGSQERALVEQAVEAGSAGIILFPLGDWHSYDGARMAADRAVPLVLVDRYLPGLDHCYVVSDNVSAGRLAAEHLAAQGYRRAAFMLHPYPFPTSVLDRIRGFHEACERLGCQFKPDWVLVGGPDLGEALEGLFRGSDVPDAIVTENDLLALDVMRALTRLGLAVPRDVAVIGFGDRESQLAMPQLTSVAQHPRRMGRLAAQHIAALARGADVPERHCVLPVELKPRASTGAGVSRTVDPGLVAAGKEGRAAREQSRTTQEPAR
ncbi:MAG: GntR family transcriptional regulator, partial [Firmicutes bacterium]|nr:GntR family transcriptional regulator [Bacillota bacterium]